MLFVNPLTLAVGTLKISPNSHNHTLTRSDSHMFQIKTSCSSM